MVRARGFVLAVARKVGRRSSHQSIGLLRREVTRRVSRYFVLEAADCRAGQRTENTVHWPLVVIQATQRFLDLPSVRFRHRVLRGQARRSGCRCRRRRGCGQWRWRCRVLRGRGHCRRCDRWRWRCCFRRCRRRFRRCGRGSCTGYPGGASGAVSGFVGGAAEEGGGVAAGDAGSAELCGATDCRFTLKTP